MSTTTLVAVVLGLLAGLACLAAGCFYLDPFYTRSNVNTTPGAIEMSGLHIHGSRGGAVNAAIPGLGGDAFGGRAMPVAHHAPEPEYLWGQHAPPPAYPTAAAIAVPEEDCVKKELGPASIAAAAAYPASMGTIHTSIGVHGVVMGAPVSTTPPRPSADPPPPLQALQE